MLRRFRIYRKGEWGIFVGGEGIEIFKKGDFIWEMKFGWSFEEGEEACYVDICERVF